MNFWRIIMKALIEVFLYLIFVSVLFVNMVIKRMA